MKKSDWEAKNHEKELKTLGHLVKKIWSGIFFIRHISIHKEMIGKDNYRVTMYLKERNEK